MADSVLNFDIVGNAASGARAFMETAAAADTAADSVDRLKDKENEAGDAGEVAGDKAGRGFLSGIRDALKGGGGGGGLLTGGGGGGGEGGILGALSFLNSGGIAGGALPGIPGISGLAATITGLVGALAAMLPALTAVGGGLAALGGGFALLMVTNAQFSASVKSTFSGIESVVGKAADVLAGPLLKALSQFAGFVTAIGPDLTKVFGATIPMIQPLVKGLEGLITGAGPGFLKLLQAAGPAMQAFSGLLSNLGSSLGSMFSDFSKAIGPSAVVLKGFGEIINAIFPFLGKLGELLASGLAPAFLAFGGALSKILPALSPVLTILGQFAGAALGDLGSVLGALATFLGGLAPAFRTLAQVAAPVFSMFENSGIFASLGDALEAIAGPLAKLTDEIVKALAPAIPVLVSLLNTLGGVLTTLVSAGLITMINALSDVIQFLSPVLPLIVEVIAVIKMWTIAQGILDAALTANPIGVIVLALAALIGIIVEVVSHWHDITAAFEAGWKLLKSGFDDVVSFIREHWLQLGAILLGPMAPVAELVIFIVQHFDQIKQGASELISDVTGFFSRLPGDILSALGDVGSLLYNAGRDIVAGLVHGLQDAAGSVVSEVGHLASDVGSFFGHVLGIGSPSRVFMQHGADIVAGLVQGIRGAAGTAVSAVQNLGSAVANAGRGSLPAGSLAGSGGGGAMITLQLQGGEGPITSAIMEAIRTEVHSVGGGGTTSVQRTFGAVA